MDMNGFLENEIRKLMDIEEQLANGLSFLASKASNDDLRVALVGHREETLEHTRRLETICGLMGWIALPRPEPVVRTILQETQASLQDAPPSAITDAFIIAAAQKAEHLEMAAYGTVAALADEMDQDEVKKRLVHTLEEEKDADKKLSNLAEHGINEAAVNLTGRAKMM